MSTLVVGLSHRSAPLSLLERAALDADAATKLLADVRHASTVGEAVVLATCNRSEVYGEVAKFHGGVEELSELLAQHAGVDLAELTPHLYVHFEDRAVHHLLSVASGLDSMVVGESQILGQVKAALRTAQDAETVGPVLNELFQQALRVGKRVHTDTGIDRAGQSLVTVGLAVVEPALGRLAGRSALVVGAGAQAALAAATLRRLDVGEIVVTNRTVERATRLARAVGGRALPLTELIPALQEADLVVACTGAAEVVVPTAAVRVALAARGPRPLALLDLALPHDIDPACAQLPGVVRVDLAALASLAADERTAEDVEAARAIVLAEAALFTAARRSARVAPTVVALRAMAADVVDVELGRLAGRLPELDAAARAEVANTVHRVVDKLLHAPTVRVKELAGEPGGQTYETALRELFALDRRAVEAVTLPLEGGPVDAPSDPPMEQGGQQP